MRLTAGALVAACGDDSAAGGVVITTLLEPLAGAGAPVKPAVYEGGAYQVDRRWHGEGEQRRVVDAVVIDNVPSQANRLEAALLEDREELGLPEIVLDLSKLTLPVHLPARISSFQFPHRNADAYLRDSELAGVAFPQTPAGRSLFEATALNPGALLEWMPQALLYGFWQSHLGKKRQQTKLARSWVSEIVGYAPATLDTKVRGLKGDPLNLSVGDAVEYNEDDQLQWSMGATAKKGKKSGDSLAELGHGQVPVAGAPGAVSFAHIEQRSSGSIPGLRRIHADTPTASASARALLLAIGIVAHVDAFARPFTLRSGCDLRSTSTAWRWLGEDGDSLVEPPDHSAAVELVSECAEAARKEGLPVGSDWPETLTLNPRSNVAAAIAKTWPGLE